MTTDLDTGQEPEKAEKWQRVRRVVDVPVSVVQRVMEAYWKAQSDPKRVLRDNPVLILFSLLTWALLVVTFVWGMQLLAAPRYVMIIAVPLVSLFTLRVALTIARGSSQAAQDAEDALAEAIWNKYIQTGRGIPRSSLNRRAQRKIRKDEVVLYKWRMHPVSIITQLNIVDWIGLAVDFVSLIYLLVNGFSPVAVAFLVTGVFLWIYKFWQWVEYSVYITDKRILRISGIIHWRSEKTPEWRIQNAVSDISGWSMFLSGMRFIKVPFGDEELETAAQDEATGRLPYVPRPNVVEYLLDKLSERFWPKSAEEPKAA